MKRRAGFAQWGLWAGLCLWLCAACIPTTTPPQLAASPGPAVRVMADEYDSGVFRVRYPAGWRVITSAAEQPASVIFAAPEADALILLGTHPQEAPSPAGYSGEIRSEQREILLHNDVAITAVLIAPPEDWQARLALFEEVLASLTASTRSGAG